MSSNTLTLHASAAEIATGNTGSLDIQAEAVSISVDVSAVSGTSPTLDFEVEWSPDGTNFGSAETADTFTRITAAKTTAERFTVKAPYYRVVWTIGGTTPSFTFRAVAVEQSAYQRVV